MSAVGNFFEAATTPPGRNAQRDQQNRQKSVADFGSNILSNMAPLLEKQMNFASTLEPTRQNAIKDMTMSLTPGQLAADGERAASAAREGTISLVGDISNQFRSQGLGEGAIAGATADAMNSGAEQENAARAAKYDPRVLNVIRQQLLAAATGGQTLPSLAAANAGASMVYGEQPVQVGQGIGDIVGQGIGTWIGNGAPRPSKGAKQS